MSELLTADELAKRLRVRPDTVRLWTRERMIPAIRVTAKVIRYDAAEVERALRERSAERDGEGTNDE